MPTQGPPPRRPAAAITPRFIWPSPNKADTLFWVEKDGNLPDNKGWAYGDAYWDAATYPDHKLIHVTPQDADGWSRWFYVNDRATEDAYNWEFSQADIGGRKFDSVQRTYLRPRADFAPGTPAVGSTMPNVPAGLFSGTYVLAGRTERRTGDETFDSLYVIDQINYVRRVTLRDVVWDEATSSPLLVTETLYYTGESVSGDWVDSYFLDETDSYWGVSADGDLRTGQQISANWFLVTNRGVVPAAVGGVATIREYTSYVQQSLPAVLDATTPVEMMDWVLKDGASRYWPRVKYARHPFSGEIRAAISEKWYSTKPTLSGLQHLLPLPVIYACPFYSLHIGPTLHPQITCYANTGTTDPVWGENAGSARTFPATKMVTEGTTGAGSSESAATDWPDSLKVADDLQPFRGGWLRREITLDLTFVKKSTAVYS